ncbi:MAG: ribose transport system substrate-binding protein, partial [Pseudonocardiales bacterium]|nr:ribose transport system substrate-binding protein [Pseudonocardiales bacterium]
MRITRSLRRHGVIVTAAVLTVALVATGCTKKSDQSAAGGQSVSPAKVKIAYVPGGPHPYFQPWKTAMNQAKTDFGLGGVTFNETSGWDQTKQNSVLQSLAAQG